MIRLFLILAAPLWAQPAPPLSVEAYTRLVVEAAPEVRQAGTVLAQAQAQYRSQLADATLPTASFSALAYPYGHDLNNAYQFKTWRLRPRDAVITTGLNWNLFNSFQDYQKTRASSLARAAAERAYKAAGQARAFAAIKAFYQLSSRSRLLEVAQKNLAAQKEQYERTQDLYRNGMRSLSDLLKGQTDWHSSQRRLAQAAAEHKAALLEFNLPLERAAFAQAELSVHLEPGTTVLPLVDADLPRALAQRPEVLKAQSELERSAVLVQQAAQGLFPSLAVNAALSRQDTFKLGTTPASYAGIPNPNYQIGLNLSLPLNFNFVSQAYAYAAAKAQRKSAAAALEAAARQVRQDLYTAFISLEQSGASYHIALQKEEIAGRTLALVTDQFRQGAANNIQLSQAQSDYLDAQVERTLDLHGIFINRALYRLAAGETLW